MASGSSLPADLIARLEQRIESHAGLSVPQWVLEARLQERATALALETAREYVDLVCGGGVGELEHLIEVLRVGETRFFRHRSHVRALTDAVIPALRAKRGKVRIWSAGCATGEEAYTMAMLMARHLPAPDYRVEIVATDISDDALAVAKRATYRDDALRHVPASWRDLGFRRNADGSWSIAPQVARLVRFEKRNLAEGGYPKGLDVILCRNVLIYFSPEARQRAVERMLASLNRDGFLFVGYSETLREFRQLEMVRTPDAVLYRKSSSPALARAVVATPPPVVRAPLPRTTEVPPLAPALATTPPAEPLKEKIIELHGRYDDAKRLTTELSAAISGTFPRVVIDLDGADYLCDDAATVLRRAQSAARSSGVDMQLVAERPGTLRWLRRGGFPEGDDE